MRTVLVTGATGALGRQVVRELTGRGIGVRRLLRRDAGAGDWLGDLRRPSTLKGAIDSVDAVISCAGASMKLGGWGDRATFREVDGEGTRNLIAAAERVGIRKFVYVSLANGPALKHTEYAGAHESAVDGLIASGLRYTVVRPTGLYSFFSEVFRMARSGRGAVIGDGSARTNPVHESDAARACADALFSNVQEIAFGGPVVYSRREIVELAFAAAGRAANVSSVPAWVFAVVRSAIRPVNPRIAALIEFGTAVSQADCVAPAYGTARLDDYFRELARECGVCPSLRSRSTSSAHSN